MTVGSQTLRPYQMDALYISKQKWEAGITRQLLALPTGTGKTCIFASLLKHHNFERNMLILVHRKELLDQADKQIRAWNPHLPVWNVGKEMGQKERCRGMEKVVIAGVQSIGRSHSARLRNFPPAWFDVIVCDEAHHSTAQTYRNVFSHFALHGADNKKLLLGVTATPFRADERRLIPDVYDELTYDMPMLRAIQEGWLCDLRSWRIEKTGTDLDSVMQGTGDFIEDQLNEAVNNPHRNGLVAREWHRLAPARKTVVFAVTVDHARKLAAAFQDYCGVTAEAVWGDDPKREAKLEAHRKGKVQVLCNCQVLTEGYDDWSVGCIVMARPTLSRVLFVQMIGRGTRIEDALSKQGLNLNQARENGLLVSKPDCVVIDFVDNTTRHDLVTFASLFSNYVDPRGRSMLELAKGSKLTAVPHPYLAPAQLEAVKQIKTRTVAVDLFRSGGSARLALNKFQSFTLQVEPSGSGYVKAWENGPGIWRMEAKIDGALYYLCTTSKVEARMKAEALAARKIKPRAEWRADAPPARPVRFKRAVWRKSHPTSSGQELTVCPYCRQPIRSRRLRKHLGEKCPNRPRIAAATGLAGDGRNGNTSLEPKRKLNARRGLERPAPTHKTELA